MGKKTVKFTDLASGESVEVLSGAIGKHVFGVTKSVNEMNSAVRWCNNHGLGEKFECSAYTLEITSVV